MTGSWAGRAVIILLIGLLAACWPVEREDERSDDGVQGRDMQPAATDSMVRGQDFAVPATAVLLDSAVVDLDGDGRAERIELHVEAERLGNGTILWEDGHRWLLLVRDGTEAFLLLERFVPMGTVRFRVIEQPEHGAVVFTEIDSSTSGVEVEVWAFDATLRAYVRRAAASATGRVRHRTPESLFR